MKEIVAVSLLSMMLSASGAARPAVAKLPPIKRQATPEAVVAEHLAALNRCDYGRLMALYPPNVHLFLPGGKVVAGREQAAAVYQTSVKPFKDGGACGLKFAAGQTSRSATR
jgi:hypothetical protein